MRIAGLGAVLLGALLGPSALGQPARPRDLDPLYDRIALDLRAGRPLVVTVHVALCDNDIIRCGHRGSGDGDEPGRNLYWGKAGMPGFFTAGRGYRRIHRDGGDGKVILERVVYRHRVRAPAPAWRRRGVTAGFDVLVVGLAYRGRNIGDATAALAAQVLGQTGGTLRLEGGATVEHGGRGHVVGYVGHNHLLDAADFRFPPLARTEPIGFFALSCWSAVHLARPLGHARSHALLLSLTMMYPGPFVVHGLVQGIAAGEPQESVYRRGVEAYAKHQRAPVGRILAAFTHDGQPRYRRRFGAPTRRP